MSVNTLLPAIDDAGEVRRWFLPIQGTASLEDRNDADFIATYARFLGMGSSYTREHTRHTTRYVRRGERCNACRWFEVRVFRELIMPPGIESLDQLTDPSDVDLGEYVLHYAGMSIVDDEVPFFRHETTASPYTVIESMTTRRNTPDRGSEVFLAKPAARALAEASANDRQLADAYVNRAVS
jgi:hypothetical protein